MEHSLNFGLLYDLPVWFVGLVFIVISLAALEVGFRLALRQQGVWKDAESGGGNLILTSMFALLGLILAFTYGAGISRNEVRKEVVIAEANALGTAFLRAHLVAEPGRTELKKALLDYARTASYPVLTGQCPAGRSEFIRDKGLNQLQMIHPAPLL